MITVLGTGTMGKGIALEFLRYNFDVNLVATEDHLDLTEINEEIKNIMLKYEFDKIETLGSLTISKNLEVVSESILVIEVVAENIDIKRNLFKKIFEFIKEDTIVASNTSSLSINDIFEGIFPMNRVVGLHFFNPVQIMKLIELVYTEKTDSSVLDKCKELSKQIDKTVVLVKNSPGFIVNRLLIPMINEASKIVDEGVATIEDVDAAMRLGANHPIGPLKLSDLIGNDITLAILNTLVDENDISKGLKAKVQSKELGRKTKKGFYDYKR